MERTLEVQERSSSFSAILGPWNTSFQPCHLEYHLFCQTRPALASSKLLNRAVLFDTGWIDRSHFVTTFLKVNNVNKNSNRFFVVFFENQVVKLNVKGTVRYFVRCI